MQAYIFYIKSTIHKKYIIFLFHQVATLNTIVFNRQRSVMHLFSLICAMTVKLEVATNCNESRALEIYHETTKAVLPDKY